MVLFRLLNGSLYSFYTVQTGHMANKFCKMFLINYEPIIRLIHFGEYSREVNEIDSPTGKIIRGRNRFYY